MNACIFTEEEQEKIIIPLVKRLKLIHKVKTTTLIAIQGGQGVGKTTLAEYLKNCLRKDGYKTESFSLDCFYKTYKERKKLQLRYPENPFYQIPRGLSGTHRIKLLHQNLQKAKSGKDFNIPFFDKSLYSGKGDVLSKKKNIRGKQDFVLFEGWCVGIPAVSSQKFIKVCKRNHIGIQEIDPKLNHHLQVLKLFKNYQPIWRILII